MNPIQNQKGQSLTEYLILILLVAVISITAVKALGTTIRSKLEQAKNHIQKDVVLRRSN